jgi:hypothetical protein
MKLRLNIKGCNQLYDYNSKLCGRDGLCEDCKDKNNEIEKCKEEITHLKDFEIRKQDNYLVIEKEGYHLLLNKEEINKLKQRLKEI